MGKLVRDQIPELIERSGERPIVCILEPWEYSQELERKLDEEVQEFHRDRNVEELADILEVVLALCDDLGCSRQTLVDTYHKKHAERGGFQQHLFLEGKE